MTKLCDKFYGQPEIEKKFNTYILQCKDRFREGKLKKEEISIIRDVVILTDNYQNSVFYIEVCTRFGQIEEALKFVNGQISNEVLTEEQKDKMRKLKKEIQEMKKRYIAKRLLRQGEGVKKAMEVSGLPEETILELNEKLLQENENNKKEENDDGEENQHEK